MSRLEGISVCIISYNGEKKLPETLDALTKSAQPPDEVIVYLDGSTDQSPEVCKPFEKLLPLRIIHQPNSGRASARNRVAECSNFSILLFIDDDILIPIDAIKSFLLLHGNHPDVVGTAPTFTRKTDHDFSVYKNSLEAYWNDVAMNSTEITFSAAYFSISATNFKNSGGFHDGLNDAEDYEFGIRLRKSGIKVECLSDIAAEHNDPITCKGFITRNRQYSNANLKLLEEHILETNKYIAPKPNPFKKWIMALFARRFMVRSIDNNHFRWMPSFIRFKIYEYVCAAFIYYYPEKTI